MSYFMCPNDIKSGPEIVTWASGTDEQIKAMLDAHYAGTIDIHDYWAVGDERIIHSTSYDDTYSTYVLSHVGGKYLSDGITECAFQVDLKYTDMNWGYTGGGKTDNNGGWRDSYIRTWCNSTFKGYFPSSIVGIFKEFINQSSSGGYKYNNPTIVNTNDYFALRSEIEVLGTNTYSLSGEGSQITWYETSSNVYKRPSSQAYYWWTRSAKLEDFDNTKYVTIYPPYTPYANAMSNSCDVAPFGCI